MAVSGIGVNTFTRHRSSTRQQRDSALDRLSSRGMGMSTDTIAWLALTYKLLGYATYSKWREEQP